MSHQVAWIQRWLSQKRWEFRLYRCTFSDDEAWNKFLGIMNGVVINHLALAECTREQCKKWHLDVINDKKFENADWVRHGQLNMKNSPLRARLVNVGVSVGPFRVKDGILAGNRDGIWDGNWELVRSRPVGTTLVIPFALDAHPVYIELHCDYTPLGIKLALVSHHSNDRTLISQQPRTDLEVS
jgi:hypothetical protein